MAKPNDIELPPKFMSNYRIQHKNGTLSVMRFTDNIYTMKHNKKYAQSYDYLEEKKGTFRYYAWHDDGTLEMKKIYKNGKINHNTGYHPNGQLAEFVTDNDTKEHTLYVRWEEDGEILEKEVYHKGKIISYYANN